MAYGAITNDTLQVAKYRFPWTSWLSCVIFVFLFVSHSFMEIFLNQSCPQGSSVDARNWLFHEYGRFGNTSSSSSWYELAYCEAKGRVKKGDRIWQIAFGSGFKCNSAVWRALRTIAPPALNPWDGIIDQYPVKGVSVPCELVFPLQSAASAGTSERQSVGRDLSNP